MSRRGLQYPALAEVILVTSSVVLYTAAWATPPELPVKSAYRPQPVESPLVELIPISQVPQPWDPVYQPVNSAKRTQANDGAYVGKPIVPLVEQIVEQPEKTGVRIQPTDAQFVYKPPAAALIDVFPTPEDPVRSRKREQSNETAFVYKTAPIVLAYTFPAIDQPVPSAKRFQTNDGALVELVVLTYQNIVTLRTMRIEVLQ